MMSYIYAAYTNLASRLDACEFGIGLKEGGY